MGVMQRKKRSDPTTGGLFTPIWEEYKDKGGSVPDTNDYESTHSVCSLLFHQLFFSIIMIPFSLKSRICRVNFSLSREPEIECVDYST